MNRSEGRRAGHGLAPEVDLRLSTTGSDFRRFLNLPSDGDIGEMQALLNQLADDDRER
ncbi:MAG: hypothetical protein ACRYG4_21645 [Janthinobacterium lividum]